MTSRLPRRWRRTRCAPCSCTNCAGSVCEPLTFQSELLPPEWIGDLAYDLAADLYGRLSLNAARALGEILEIDYPATMPNRFG